MPSVEETPAKVEINFTTWLRVLQPSKVTVDKLHNFSVPHFPNLQGEDDNHNNTHFLGLCEKLAELCKAF